MLDVVTATALSKLAITSPDCEHKDHSRNVKYSYHFAGRRLHVFLESVRVARLGIG
jgi:hypothetical protein